MALRSNSERHVRKQISKTLQSSRPLVVRVAALGDTILATAMVRAVSELWQRPCDVVVHDAWAGMVMDGLDGVGEVVGLTSRSTPYWLCPSQWRLVRWLRQRGPGPTYVVDKRRATFGLLERGGVSAGWTVSNFDTPWRQRQHHLDHLLELVARGTEMLTGTPVTRPDSLPLPRLRVSREETAECFRWMETLGWKGEPVLAVQTQSRRTSRGSWPEERWRAAIEQILGRLGEGLVLLIGARHEASAVQRVADRCRGMAVVNTARDLHLRRLFAVLAASHSCISLDTGPAHAAAALGCPLVVLVCDTHPDEYRPVAAERRVAQVCALRRERWPDTQEEFARVHRTADIEVGQVVEAWNRITQARDGTR
jgi:heptosyltransferase-2/heptosyltransferase-3